MQSFFFLLWTTEHVNQSKRQYSCFPPQPTAPQQHHKLHQKYMTELNSAIAALNLVFHVYKKIMDSFWNTKWNLSSKGWGHLFFFPLPFGRWSMGEEAKRFLMNTFVFRFWEAGGKRGVRRKVIWYVLTRRLRRIRSRILSK